ncbi:dTDP-4-amino-4,6-dideoxygalactose transaminase [Candidatus Providencia siddallii]|uniref:dTDP-4-amino-4,6-dideoxygalactose transaminase n=1 Tax=Candidatus Providencia siddallii TaxID=1715285 RepID=A0ABP1CG80_9GAMM
MIPFNKPPIVGTELIYIKQLIKSNKIFGNNYFGKLCENWMEKQFNCKKVHLTPSCTASLEMASILINISPGDEIIMPSFTFVSTSNAFILRGAKIVFVDIRKDTMNIDETKIEEAITKFTRAIVPVHYAGIACEMDVIMNIAKKYNLFVIEDAAHGIMSTYKGKILGTIGHIGCYSFHETKNYSSGGEGGAILINDVSLIDRAEIIREKGTNRNKFLNGQIDKYTWCDIGSSFLLSNLQAAYLWAQFEESDKINDRRVFLWKRYFKELKELEYFNYITLMTIPEGIKNNGHIFYLKFKNINERVIFSYYMKTHGILTAFHYVALHTSPAGIKFTRFNGKDENTTFHSERLIRLPIFYNMTDEEQSIVINRIKIFFSNVTH